jgi:ActR/RegA family two-component response regulator
MGHIVMVGAEQTTSLPPLKQSLAKEGHEVTDAHGSLEAIRTARRRPVDVLITNPATPVEEDLALVEEVREVRPDARTLVLAPAMSDADVIAAIRANVFACFTAPFDEAEIADMTRTALKASHWKDGIEVVSALPYWVTLRVCCRLLTADRLTRFMTEWRSVSRAPPQRDGARRRLRSRQGHPGHRRTHRSRDRVSLQGSGKRLRS